MTALPLAYLCGTIYLLVKLWISLRRPLSLPGTSENSPILLWIRIAIVALMLLAACSLFISIAIRNSQAPFWIMKFLHVAGSVWMLYMSYLILILIPTDIARLTIPCLKGATWFTSTKIFWSASALVAIVLIGGYINYINPRIVEMDIDLTSPHGSSETNRSATELSSEIKIVAISDVHLGYGTGKWLTRRYIKQINAQKPDIVLIAGDLIDNSTKPVANQLLHLELNKIEAPMGIYMAPGNHEYISGISECRELLAQTKVQLLQDSIITISLANQAKMLQIIGRDDRSNRNRKTLEELLELTCAKNKTNIANHIIVVDHQPYNLAKTDSLGIDIQISGHTHRGQIWPFNLLTDKIYEQSHGYRKWSNSHIWVSSGLSLWGPPFRIGTRSEIGVITIQL